MNFNSPLQKKTNREDLIKLAGWIALVGNLLLAISKLIVGLTANSLAVLSDGIDSATDVAVACITVAISRIIATPSDKEHPWGHGRAESTATMVVAFIIFYAGMELVTSSGKEIIALLKGSFENKNIEPITLIITFVSIIGKLFLSLIQYKLGKKTESPMVLANAKNMVADSVVSTTVLIGLSFANIFQAFWLDSAIAFAMGLWVIKNAIEIFLQMNLELMDGTQDKELYQTLFNAIKSVPGVSNPHRARIRKIASRWDIDLDIEVDATMTVHDAHEIAEKVELAVRKAIPDVYDIMVHIEPAGHGDHHPTEEFGLSESDI
ncbi:MAG: cation transporter [Spirochaetaceae bacterium]|nr:cation transporter [Spirochaetaceae bacterium]